MADSGGRVRQEDPAVQPDVNPEAAKAAKLSVAFHRDDEAPAGPTFAGLGLRPDLVDSLARMGFTHPTEVQQQAFPLVLDGQDLMVQSRTGTGKTFAYVLPTLQRMDLQATGVQALVIAPTRELATQVAAVIARLGRPLGLHVATLTGGVAYGEQLRALRHGVQVVVGTPGRLLDHQMRGTLDLSHCRTVVLDEADEILDMGFKEDLEKILGALPRERQNLLFSATLEPGIEEIARRYMRTPKRLGLSSGLAASSTLTHAFFEVAINAKYEALVNLINVEAPELAIIFCHTKAVTEDLAKRLVAEGFKAAYLTGDLPQQVRTRTLDSFRKHQIAILVATDVAARGLDVSGITHVINYDVPRSVETYIHRSGRAGRAGRSGLVLNIVAPPARSAMRAIIREAKLKADIRPIPQAAEVFRQVRERFTKELTNRADASNEFDDFRELAKDLLERIDPVALVTALLQDVQSSSGQLAVGYDVGLPQPEERRRPGPYNKGQYGKPYAGTPFKKRW